MVPATSVPATLRLLTPRDAASARALVVSVLGDAPYCDVLVPALETALTQANDEYQTIVASDASTLAGVIVFGHVAGACGAGRIHLIAVDGKTRRQGLATELVSAACARLADEGGRFITIELPADPRLTPARQLAERAGFREEGRIDDYIRDGTSLLLLRRELRSALDAR